MDPYNEILGSLLGALKWKGHQNDILQAKPYGLERHDISSFRKMMVNLGYKSIIKKSSRMTIQRMAYPALAFTKNGTPKLVISRNEFEDIYRKISCISSIGTLERF